MHNTFVITNLFSEIKNREHLFIASESHKFGVGMDLAGIWDCGEVRFWQIKNEKTARQSNIARFFIFCIVLAGITSYAAFIRWLPLRLIK